MTIVLKQVETRKDYKQFIYLPIKLHKGHTNWVPPVWLEEKKFFNPKRNRAFEYSDTCLLLALTNNKIVGRIMGIINHKYNSFKNEKNARFGYLECVNDQEVAHSLLNYIEKWARQKGMKQLIGPMGFSDQDPEGFLIEGFEHKPTLATYYNFEYVIDLLENEGYAKEVDYVVYDVRIPEEIPEIQTKIFNRAVRRGNFRLIEFGSKSEIKKYIKPVLTLMNECFEDIYGYYPLNDSEMDRLARQYLFLLDPRFIKVVLDEDQLVSGFIISIPNMADGIRKAKGRLLPFGFIRMLLSAKRSKQLDLLLGGVKSKYQGCGVDVMMGLKTVEEAKRSGFVNIDSHHELETNYKMRAEMERWGGRVYKRYRIFKKII